MVRLITVPFLVMLGVVFITVNPTLQAHAAPRTITFGISASMSGGAWKPGPRYTAGIHAAFKEARDAGGVRGDYDPYLRVMDDQYNTTMTASNLAALFSDTTVDFVLGTVGTGPTRESEATYIAQNTVMIAPMMGYVPIHTEFHPYIVNVRASYGDEAVAMINLAVSKHMTRIGLLYLLGIVPLELYEDSMAQIGHKFTVVESYISGTSIDAANFARIVLERGSQALVIFCTTDAASKVIDEVARQSQANPNYTVPIIISASGSGDDLLEHIRDNNYNLELYQTQVVPHPEGGSELAASFRRAITAYEGPAAQLDFLAVEGYIVGRFVCEILPRYHLLATDYKGNHFQHAHVRRRRRSARAVQRQLQIPHTVGRPQLHVQLHAGHAPR
eukprot:PhM_4_TR9132/c0_g2_i3/m.34681